MKSKLFLEEGEISRILNMHKKAIQEQINVNGDEVENNQVQMDEELSENPELRTESTEDMKSYTVKSEVSFENAQKFANPQLTIYKGAKFVPVGNGKLVATTSFNFKNDFGSVTEDPDSAAGVEDNYIDYFTFKGKVIYYCVVGKFKVPSKTTEYEYYAEDGSSPEVVKQLNKLCNASNAQTPTNNNKKVNTTTQSKCPKIEKSFLDKGYVMITQKRYQELANDKTRVRKYAWCPISKTNLFFGKVIQGTPEKDGWSKDTRGNGRGDGRGNGSGGGSVSFDYDSVIKAINDKCPGGGGGNANLDIDIDGEKIVPTPKMPTDVYNAIG